MDTPFVDNFVEELNYFTSRKGISLLPPATEEDILEAEKVLNCKFSSQMAYFLKRINGGRILEVNIKGVQSSGIRKIPRGLNIVGSNEILRTFEGWVASWLQVGEDGFGNYYVVDTAQHLNNGEYPVIFVDHEAIGEEGSSIEYAASYSEFLLKVVREMKKIYTPNGDLKDLLNSS